MGGDVKKYEQIESLTTYFKELKKYKKRLTMEEEQELGYRIKKGDERALKQLVQYNLKFVITIAKKYRKYTDASFADLISEGNLGLIRAAQKYDPTKNIKFSSYANWWIKATIRNYIDNYEGKVEVSVIDDYQTINLTENDTVKHSINEDFEKKMNGFQNREVVVEDLIKCLEEREKKVIMLFFGLGNNKEMNLEEVSKEMSLTKERIRQIKDYALIKMRCKALSSKEFDTYRELI